MDLHQTAERFAPSITQMIRMDHSHVLIASHRYTAAADAAKKTAIVRHVCLALEVHAQLEEEIFYPALRSVGADVGGVLDDAKPQHDQMRRLIGELRQMTPTDAQCDATFLSLMRAVMHHVADEEAVLLPAAERLLKDRLGALGVEMTRRRMQLIAPHAGEIAATSLQALPSGALWWAGALLAGTFMLGRHSRRYRR